jgi:hypothetical protein
MNAPPCPQAWHMGLPAGVLRECRYTAGHRGWHRDVSDELQWGGKLTEDERARADQLRQLDGENR